MSDLGAEPMVSTEGGSGQGVEAAGEPVEFGRLLWDRADGADGSWGGRPGSWGGISGFPQAIHGWGWSMPLGRLGVDVWNKIQGYTQAFPQQPSTDCGYSWGRTMVL